MINDLLNPWFWLLLIECVGVAFIIIMLLWSVLIAFDMVPLSDAEKAIIERERRKEVERLWPYIKEKIENEL